MSRVPRWISKFPRPLQQSRVFDMRNFFEDYEDDLGFISSYPTGLSVSSDEKNIYVEAHVPGLSAKDIEVTVDNENVLWIKGEKKEEDKNKKRKFYRKSQTYFSYCVPLWEEVDLNVEPEARCHEGVMKITFAKKKQMQQESKKIEIKE